MPELSNGKVGISRAPTNSPAAAGTTPVLALDVDGVLNPDETHDRLLKLGLADIGYLTHRYQGPDAHGGPVDLEVRLHPLHGRWLSRLRGRRRGRVGNIVGANSRRLDRSSARPACWPAGHRRPGPIQGRPRGDLGICPGCVDRSGFAAMRRSTICPSDVASVRRDLSATSMATRPQRTSPFGNGTCQVMTTVRPSEVTSNDRCFSNAPPGSGMRSRAPHSARATPGCSPVRVAVRRLQRKPAFLR